MKYLFITLSCCLLLSCSDSFINHKLKFEKLGDCSGYSESIKIISNINGERFEFFSCLDEEFDGKNYTIDRKGDSVIVGFPKTSSHIKALFKLILDVDAKPNYHHIILDGRKLTIVPAKK